MELKFTALLAILFSACNCSTTPPVPLTDTPRRLESAASEAPVARPGQKGSQVEARRGRHPVRWADDLELDAVEHADRVARAVEPESLVTLSAGEQYREPMSCAEWRELRREGYTPSNTVEIQNDGYALYRCGTLSLLVDARPAQTSYLEGLVWDRGLLKWLPPVLSSMMDEASERAALGAHAHGQSWAQFDPKAKGRKAEGTLGLDITEARAQGLTRLRPTAWGDFNRDGIADVVVFVTNADPSGPYADHRLALLTRRAADAPLALVRFWSP